MSPPGPPFEEDGDSEHSSRNIPAADMINFEFIYAHFLNTCMPSPPSPLPQGEGRKTEKQEGGRRFPPSPFLFFRRIMGLGTSHVSGNMHTYIRIWRGLRQ